MKSFHDVKLFWFLPKISIFSLLTIFCFSTATLNAQNILSLTSWDEPGWPDGVLRSFDHNSHAILDSFVFAGDFSEVDGSLYRIHDLAMHPDGMVYAPHDSALVRIHLENNGYYPTYKIPYSEHYQMLLADSIVISNTTFFFFNPPIGLCIDHLGRFYMGATTPHLADRKGYVFRYDPSLDTTVLLLTFPGAAIDDLEFWDGKLVIPERNSVESVWTYDIYTQKLDTLSSWNIKGFVVNMANDATPCGTENLYIYKGDSVYTHHMLSGTSSTWQPPDLRWSSAGSTSDFAYYGSLPNMRLDSLRIVGGDCFSDFDIQFYIPAPRRDGALYSLDGLPLDTSLLWSGLTPGTHIIEIIDSLGCFVTDTFILPHDPDEILLLSIDTPRCGTLGSLHLSSEGHILEFSSDASQWGSELSLDSLSSDSLLLYFRLHEGCLDSLLIDLSGGSNWTVIPSLSPAICGQNHGSFSFENIGGNAPFEFSVDGNPVVPDSSYALSVGSYTLNAVDADGCELAIPILVDSIPQGHILAIHILDTPACDINSGRISILTSQTDLLLSLNGSTPASDTLFDSLEAGDYLLTSIDSLDCLDSFFFSLPQKNPPLLSFTPQPASCQLANGSLILDISHGTPPYITLLDNDTLWGNPISNLLAGQYLISVVDALGCTSYDSVIIPQDNPVLIDSFELSTTPCDSSQASASFFSALDSLTFLLSSGQANSNGVFDSLPIGSYHLTVSNPSGCQDTLSFSIFGSLDSFFLERSCRVNQTDTSLHQAFGLYCDTTFYTIRLPLQITPSLQADFSGNQGDTVEFSILIQGDQLDTFQLLAVEPLSILEFHDGHGSLVHPPPGLYSLTLSGPDSCSWIIPLHVNTNNLSNVFIPNVFSPNGDDINDLWRIYPSGNGPFHFRLSIYDRWGQLVFKTAGTDATTLSWNGKSRDRDMPTGVYIYSLEIWINDQRKVYNGDVTLLK